MNVRIEESNIRFKVTEDELKMLLNGRCVHTKVTLLDKTLVASITPKGTEKYMVPKLILDNTDAYLNLLISPLTVKELFNMGPSRTGLQHKIGGLSVTLQVNMKDICHT